ncbi:MAG: DNA primase [Anaeromassilibacillus sp.]|nr:DNA primase [Anaeromassilibacillus sp.]MDY3779241.1 DNA primase [Candidatus Limousia pullorum]
MSLPEEFLQELKYRNDITEVVSSYVNLKRRGRNMVGLCPFHSEKTPSFNIYSENGSFYCFGCGAGGDVITFVMKIENLDYMEAVRFLAQRAGMTMPDTGYDDSMNRLRTRIYEANREAARFFYSCLNSPEGAEARNYLAGRQLSSKTIVRFGLGYSPKSRYSLCNHLKSKGFKESEIVAANLAFQSKSGKGIYDRFSDRVMFPIIDLRGNVIAFGGRLMGDGKPKYLNTSDTPVFKKSNNLFSLNNAKNSGERTLILCEGYMDVIAVNQAGFQNAVATLGTALTSEQAILMKRYADEVVICYDADEAGQKATARAIEILRNAGIQVRVLTVPDGKDPDEFIKKHGENGSAAFKNLLEKSKNDMDYRLAKLKSSFNLETAQGRVSYLNGAIKMIAALDNPVEKDIYLSGLSEEMGVEKNALLEQIKRVSRSKAGEIRREEMKKLRSEMSGMGDKINPEHAKYPRGVKAEESLIAYLVHNPDKLDFVLKRITPDDFVTTFNKKLFEYFRDKIQGGYGILTGISADFTPEESGKIFGIISKYNSMAATTEAAAEYINAIIEEKLKTKMNDLSTAEDTDIMDYLKNLREKKN